MCFGFAPVCRPLEALALEDWVKVGFAPGDVVVGAFFVGVFGLAPDDFEGLV